jgi:serine/threonine-protein kinase
MVEPIQEPTTPDWKTPPLAGEDPGHTTPEQPGAATLSDRRPPPADWPRLPGYQVVGRLGQGGVGTVYEARDLALGRTVALKVLQSGTSLDPGQVLRFHSEAQAMARLDHPHVVPIYGEGEHEGRLYFTMKLMAGGSLAQNLPRLTADLRGAVALMEKVARAVQFLHDKKVIHRDLKPLNILLDGAGEPYVSDFGLAKLLDSDLEMTQSGALVGTVAYMSPEQAGGQTGRIGPLSDVWALGVILFQLLTGTQPFAGGHREEVLCRILAAAPPEPRTVRPEIDRDLEAIVLRCLRRRPAERYPSAGALAGALAGWLAGERRPASSVGWPGRVLRGVRARPLWGLAALGATAALAAALLLPGAKPRGKSDSQPPGDIGPRPPVAPAPPEPLPPDALRLIGDHGPPATLRWLLGGADAAVVNENPDVPFSFRSSRVSMGELHAGPPWPRFRFAAEVRHDGGEKNGEVGIYLAHREYASPRGTYHGYCKLGFSESPQDRRYRRLEFWMGCCPEVNPDSPTSLHSLARPYSLPQDDRVPAGERPWRPLAVAVTPSEVRVYSDGTCIATEPMKELRRKAADQSAKAHVPGLDFNPAGGLGIYAHQATASFRRVVLAPLP